MTPQNTSSAPEETLQRSTRASPKLLPFLYTKGRGSLSGVFPTFQRYTLTSFISAELYSGMFYESVTLFSDLVVGQVVMVLMMLPESTRVLERAVLDE